jgi:hypothetical protein
MAGQYPPDIDTLRGLGWKQSSTRPVRCYGKANKTRPPFAVSWNGLRTWSPLRAARWDPHPEPEGEKAPLRVAYFGEDVKTCLADV